MRSSSVSPSLHLALFAAAAANARSHPPFLPPLPLSPPLSLALFVRAGDAHARVATAALRALAALLNSPYASSADAHLERLVPLVFSRSVDAASDVRRAAAAVRDSLAHCAASEPLGCALTKTLSVTKSPKVLVVLLQHLQTSPPALLCVRGGVSASTSSSAAHAVGVLRTLHLTLERLIEDRAPQIRAEAAKSLQALDAAERQGMADAEQEEGGTGDTGEGATRSVNGPAASGRLDAHGVGAASELSAKHALSPSSPFETGGAFGDVAALPEGDTAATATACTTGAQQQRSTEWVTDRPRLGESTRAASSARADDGPAVATPTGPVAAVEDEVVRNVGEESVDAAPGASDKSDAVEDLEAQLAETLGEFESEDDFSTATCREPWGLVAVSTQDIMEEERRLDAIASKLSPSVPYDATTGAPVRSSDEAARLSDSPTSITVAPLSFAHNECALVSSIVVDGAESGGCAERTEDAEEMLENDERLDHAIVGLIDCRASESMGQPLSHPKPLLDDELTAENRAQPKSDSWSRPADASARVHGKAVLVAASPVRCAADMDRIPIVECGASTSDRVSEAEPTPASGCETSGSSPSPTSHGRNPCLSDSLLLASQENSQSAAMLLALLQRVEVEPASTVALQALRAACGAAAGVLSGAGQ